jgi:hypothetical protein
MKRIWRTSLLAVSVALAESLTWAQDTQAPRVNKAEIQRMIRQAHSPEDYRAIADYFRARQKAFDNEAQAEKVEWQRRSQNVMGPAAKYPRPVDSSKYRFDYFSYESLQMAQQALHFEALASKTP